MMTQKSITINGLSVAYQEQKPDVAKGLPIVYLHGWLDNSASFEPLIEALPDYHHIALDLVGHGHSSHISEHAYYHFLDGVSHLVHILEALSFKRYILVGHSLGACLASILAGVMGSQLAKLILIDAIGPLTAPENTSCEQLNNYLQKSQLLKIKRHSTYQNIEKACYHRAQSGYLSESLLMPIVKRGLVQREDGLYQWRHDPRLLLPSPLKLTQAQVLAFLKEIQAETLFIRAKNGFKVAGNVMDERLAMVKSLKTKLLDGGHHIHIEQPQVCGQLIESFIEST